MPHLGAAGEGTHYFTGKEVIQVKSRLVAWALAYCRWAQEQSAYSHDKLVWDGRIDWLLSLVGMG